MDGKSVKLRFRLGLAAALVSICLSAYVIARAQSGPSWEVPVAVVEELRTLPPISMILAIVGAIMFAWIRRLGGVGPAARRGLLLLLLIAFALPFIIWIFEPEQWPFHSTMLSSLV